MKKYLATDEFSRALYADRAPLAALGRAAGWGRSESAVRVSQIARQNRKYPIRESELEKVERLATIIDFTGTLLKPVGDER